MKKFFFIFLGLYLSFASLVQATKAEFIFSPDDLCKYYDVDDVVMITSTGRSGSSLLTFALARQASDYSVILKSHLLPPSPQYKGKIIFIFSNPDKAAESIFHLSLTYPDFARRHFMHVQNSNKDWFNQMDSTHDQTLSNQTLDHNLLAQDALGCHQQLIEWLYQTTPCLPNEAQILAIKYENLWDIETVEALKDFLGLNVFNLPTKKERGYSDQEMDPKEVLFRFFHNQGTKENPKYPAYDAARLIWEEAPAFQYLKLNP